jgi:hypothetical protein
MPNSVDVGLGDLLLPGGVLILIAEVSKHRRVSFHGLAVCASNLNFVGYHFNFKYQSRNKRGSLLEYQSVPQGS